MCADLNLPLLGKVPLDPRIARSCDEGKSFLDQVPDSPAAAAYRSIVQSEFFHQRARKAPNTFARNTFVLFENLSNFKEGKLSTARGKYVIL